MSKISEASRTAILNELINSKSGIDEIAAKFDCTLNFVSDTKETLNFLLQEGLLSRNDVDWSHFQKATAPLKRLVHELIKEGANSEQAKNISKLSRYQVKALYELLKTEGEIPRSLLTSKPSLEARLLASLFAVIYLRFKKPYSVSDVILARKVTLNEAKLLGISDILTLSDAINVASAIRGGEPNYCLAICPECQHAYLKVPSTSACPFCEWRSRIAEGE